MKKTILAVFALLVLVFNVSEAKAENDTAWSLGLGIGPNFSQLDAVNDSLKSSFGGTLWAQKNWIQDENRLDLSFNYFSFVGSTDYHALSAAYGWTFNNKYTMKPFLLFGGGIGRANNFPLSVEKNQGTFHLFSRFGAENVFKIFEIDCGLMLDAFYVKLNGNLAKEAFLALPMITFKYAFNNEVNKSETMAPAAHVIQKDVDSDLDGVFDSVDECPNTLKNTKVNSIGCAKKIAVRKNIRVEFETSKDVILLEYYKDINEFATYLNLHSDLDVIIEGHTDNVGAKKYNEKLSLKRAESVKKYLVQQNINKNRIKAVGYGPNRPEVKNSTEANKKKNRRVIAVIQ